MAKNSGKKSGPKRDPKTGRVSGGNPGNSGGKPGRSGRKPDSFKALCREILEDEEVQAELRKAAKERATAGYGGVMKMLASYAEGMPEQSVKHSGTVTVSWAERIKRARERTAAES